MASLRQYDPEVAEVFKSLLFNDDPSKVAKWHAIFKDPVFFPKNDMSLKD